MLARSVEACPAELWDNDKYKNRFWHISYHVLFYTDFYLSSDERSYQPSPQYIPEYQYLGNFPWESDKKPNISAPCSKEHILRYILYIHSILDDSIEGIELSDSSGFDWLPFNKLELQLYNIRHIQHHTAQLNLLLQMETGVSIEWIGMG